MSDDFLFAFDTPEEPEVNQETDKEKYEKLHGTRWSLPPLYPGHKVVVQLLYVNYPINKVLVRKESDGKDVPLQMDTFFDRYTRID